MYCKKCKTLLKDNETTCPNCLFDNVENIDTTKELENISTSVNKSKNQSPNILPIIILLFLLSIGIVCIYLIKDSKASDDKILTEVPTTLKITKKKFKFNKLVFNYTDNFGTSKNTIFYKNNTAININFKNITNEEYNNIINANECLDYKLGTIDTKTYAGDNFYSYVFIYQDEFYEITVNYVNDITIYNESMQLEISQILKSIQLK